MDKGEFAGIVKRNTRLKVKFSLRFATRRYQQRCQSQRRTSYAHSNFGRIHYTGRQLSIPNRFRGVSTNEIRKCSWRNNLVIWNSCVWNRYSRFDVFYPLRTKHSILLSRSNVRVYRRFSFRKCGTNNFRNWGF